MAEVNKTAHVLSIDIGGSHVKATIVDQNGKLLFDYKKINTPIPASPDAIMAAIRTLITGFPPFDLISAGFPGYVRDGVIKTAPNLGTKLWADIDFSKSLADALGKPAKVVNDADMQGMGIIKGKGLEMVVTLGTGFGTAFAYNGVLLPHFEIAHHPFTSKKTYDMYIGQKALDTIGSKRWNKRMEKVLAVLKTVFNYDTLYLGGGNSSKIKFQVDENVRLVSNVDGIHGGYWLWTKKEV